MGLIGAYFQLTPTFDADAEEVEFQEYTFSQEQRDAQKMVQLEMQQQQLQGTNVPIFRIVLTGGPCGGKSTALAQISDRLLSLGFRVFRVPEVATLLITGTGLNPGMMGEAEKHNFEGTIIRAKIAMEDLFHDLAQAGGQPCVIICDRGTMDTAAYMKTEDFDVLLDEHRWNVVDLRDKRYDTVIHMVTAAIGAEKYYTTENNAARSETLNEARDLDFKVLNAWVGHPHIRIVDNSTEFAEKINRVEQIICQVVGAPRPIKGDRKFLVSTEIVPEVAAKAKVKIETFQVEQTYLTPRGESQTKGYNYLRRRGSHGTYTYTHSMVRSSGTGSDEQVILERAISGREYIALLKQSDVDRISVKKKVQCFLWNNVYYELQTYLEPDIGLTVVKTEVAPDAKVIQFPWFLNIKGEVTGFQEFSTYYLAGHYNVQPDGSNLNWKDNQELTDAYQRAKTDFLKQQERKKYRSE